VRPENGGRSARVGLKDRSANKENRETKDRKASRASSSTRGETREDPRARPERLGKTEHQVYQETLANRDKPEKKVAGANGATRALKALPANRGRKAPPESTGSTGRWV